MIVGRDVPIGFLIATFVQLRIPAETLRRSAVLRRSIHHRLAVTATLLSALALPIGCGGGGGTANPGISEAPQPTESVLYPDVASAVFQGGLVSDAIFGDVPGQVPIDDDLRAVFRFSLVGQIPAGSTILSATLGCPITEYIGQSSSVTPAHFESRAIGLTSPFNATDVLIGDWGPGTQALVPTPSDPGLPDRWLITDQAGVGIANTIQAIVGPMSLDGNLLNDLIVRVRGTPNLSGSPDQMKLGGIYPPTNSSYTVTLKIQFHPPEL